MEVKALLDSAQRCYSHAFDLDSTLAEARYRLAFLHMHHGRPRSGAAPGVGGGAA